MPCGAGPGDFGVLDVLRGDCPAHFAAVVVGCGQLREECGGVLEGAFAGVRFWGDDLLEVCISVSSPQGRERASPTCYVQKTKMEKKTLNIPSL